MPTEAITGAPPAGAITTDTRPAPRELKQEMDGEVFLNLLVTQLRNQDPSNSMDTGEIVAQTTSLAMMESLTKVATTTNEAFSLQMRTAAADLIGKDVSYIAADGTTKHGRATSVSFVDSVPLVAVDSVPVRMDAISEIRGTDASTTPSATDGDTTNGAIVA